VSSIERGDFGGILGHPNLFADLYGIYSDPEPGYRLIGDTLASFESQDQQLDWFEMGGGLSLARRVYSTHGLVWIARHAKRIYRAPSVAFRTARGRRLRGRDIAIERSFVADLLQSYGIAPRYIRNLIPPSGGWLTAPLTDWPSLEFVGGAPLSVDTTRPERVFLTGHSDLDAIVQPGPRFGAMVSPLLRSEGPVPTTLLSVRPHSGASKYTRG